MFCMSTPPSERPVGEKNKKKLKKLKLMPINHDRGTKVLAKTLKERRQGNRCSAMDSPTWTFVREELSTIFTELIGEEVCLSEEEARQVIRRMCPEVAPPGCATESSPDPVSVG